MPLIFESFLLKAGFGDVLERLASINALGLLLVVSVEILGSQYQRLVFPNFNCTNLFVLVCDSSKDLRERLVRCIDDALGYLISTSLPSGHFRALRAHGCGLKQHRGAPFILVRFCALHRDSPID